MTRASCRSSYVYFADRDPLTRAVMDRMLAGVSTRKFVVVGEPVGVEVEGSASATSKMLAHPHSRQTASSLPRGRRRVTRDPRNLCARSG